MRNVPGSGNCHKTSMLLDAGDPSSSFPIPDPFAWWRKRERPGPMVLSVNGVGDFFSMRGDACNVELNAGEEVTVRIKQREFVATGQFRELPLGVRKCRFHYENPGTLDRKYVLIEIV